MSRGSDPAILSLMKIFIGTVCWFFLGIAYVFFIVSYSGWMQGSTEVKNVLEPATVRAVISKLFPTDAKHSTTTAIGEERSIADFEAQIEVGDARPQLVANFLERYKSPMQPYDEYGLFFVALADKYGFDFRLLPAISMQESGLCKSIPEGSFNCLGLGIHARGTWGFASYRENFEAAAKILKKNYIDIGLTTPEQIMTKYTPSSNGSWANSVNQWMAEMRYNDRALGKELKTDVSVLEFAQSSPNASDSSKND